MNPDITKLSPPELWKNFAEICAIPHPSGQEDAVREHLIAKARQHDLLWRVDAAGNLRIDRPAAPGWENMPCILLQGHMDMVPQKEPELDFDFTRDPICPRACEDGFVRATGTTLGGDDGIGLAAAITLLTDPDYHAGPLAMLATVSEETGLCGALALEPSMLQCDMMINLDSEEEGYLCIGCAGGSTSRHFWSAPQQAVPQGYTGVKILLDGLQGGHSGCDIHRSRANAIRQMAEFLFAHADTIRVAEIHSGEIDNAIPRTAEVIAAVPESAVELLKDAAQKSLAALRQKFTEETSSVTWQITTVPCPAAVWGEEFNRKFLGALLELPRGVQRVDEEHGDIITSSHYGVLQSSGDQVRITCHPRSFHDAEYEKVEAINAQIMQKCGAVSETFSAYPGWEPDRQNPMLPVAHQVYQELFSKPIVDYVMHAGVECGIFYKKMPGLRMISIGPDLHYPHSPSEALNIASTERFFRFLKTLIPASQKTMYNSEAEGK